MAESTPDYIDKLYGIMQSGYGDKFTLTPDQFRNKITTDSNYTAKVYGIMQSSYGDKFTHTNESFYDKVGLKKKEPSEVGSGVLSKPSEEYSPYKYSSEYSLPGTKKQEDKPPVKPVNTGTPKPAKKTILGQEIPSTAQQAAQIPGIDIEQTAYNLVKTGQYDKANSLIGESLLQNKEQPYLHQLQADIFKKQAAQQTDLTKAQELLKMSAESYDNAIGLAKKKTQEGKTLSTPSVEKQSLQERGKLNLVAGKNINAYNDFRDAAALEPQVTGDPKTKSIEQLYGDVDKLHDNWTQQWGMLKAMDNMGVDKNSQQYKDQQNKVQLAKSNYTLFNNTLNEARYSQRWIEFSKTTQNYGKQVEEQIGFGGYEMAKAGVGKALEGITGQRKVMEQPISLTLANYLAGIKDMTTHERGLAVVLGEVETYFGASMYLPSMQTFNVGVALLSPVMGDKMDIAFAPVSKVLEWSGYDKSKMSAIQQDYVSMADIIGNLAIMGLGHKAFGGGFKYSNIAKKATKKINIETEPIKKAETIINKLKDKEPLTEQETVEFNEGVNIAMTNPEAVKYAADKALEKKQIEDQALSEKTEQLPTEPIKTTTETLPTEQKTTETPVTEYTIMDALNEIPNIKAKQAGTGTIYIELPDGNKIRISDHEPNFTAKDRSFDYEEIYTKDVSGNEINTTSDILQIISEKYNINLPESLKKYIKKEEAYQKEKIELSKKSQKEREEILKNEQQRINELAPFVNENTKELEVIEKQAVKYGSEGTTGDKRRKRTKSFFNNEVQKKFGKELSYSDYKTIREKAETFPAEQKTTETTDVLIEPIKTETKPEPTQQPVYEITKDTDTGKHIVVKDGKPIEQFDKLEQAQEFVNSQQVTETITQKIGKETFVQKDGKWYNEKTNEAATEKQTKSLNNKQEQFDIGKETTEQPQKQKRTTTAGEKAEGDFATDIPQSEAKIKEEVKTENLKPIEFPELVKLAKQMGQLVRVNPKLAERIRGIFKRDKGIELNPDQFKEGNEEQLAKTLAHEIGHADDYLPDKTMARGNILGRIASLKDYMRKYLPFKKGAEGELTSADIERIKTLSKEEAKKTEEVIEREIDEEIITKTGITPQEVLDIWNTVEGSMNKELTDFIKGLSSKEKKSIVKEALKGIVSDKLKRFVTEVRNKTGKKIIVRETIKKEWRDIFKDNIEKEIQKRKLWKEKEIYDELYALSKKWRPFDEATADEKFLKYRKSSKELYADALSVLLNNPGYLQQEAPKFFEAFFNYLPEKSQFEKAYFDLQKLLHDTDSDAVIKSRIEDMKAGFRRGYEMQKKKREMQKDKRKNPLNIFQQFIDSFVSKKNAALRKLNKDKKGKYLPKTLDRKQDITNEIELMKYQGNKDILILHDIKENVIKPLLEAGIDTLDISSLMTTIRNVTGRVEKANPLGFQKEVSNKINEYITNKFTPEQAEIVKTSMENFHKKISGIMEDAYKSGIISDKMMDETIRPNAETYVTYRSVDRIIDTYVDSAFREIKGMLSEHEDPIISTTEKAIAIARATQRNNAKRKYIDALKETEGFDQAEKKVIGKKSDGTPIMEFTKKEGMEVLTYMENGELKGVYVDKAIKSVFDTYNDGEIDMFTKAVGFFSKVFTQAVTKYYPRFAFGTNLAKDSLRSIKNAYSIASSIEGEGGIYRFTKLFRMPSKYIKILFSEGSILESNKMVRGKYSKDVREMIEYGALDITSGLGKAFDYDLHANETIGALFDKYGIYNTERGGKIKAISKEAINLYSDLADTAEFASKITGWKLLAQYIPDAKTRAYYVRNYFGTPNRKEGGKYTKWSNTYMPFSNVMAQAMKSEYELMADSRTAKAYWTGTAAYIATPAILTGLAAAGVFGDDLKQWYLKFGDYYTKNFISIPFGLSEDESGRALGFTMPMDDVQRFIYGTIYTITKNIANEELPKLKDFKFFLNQATGITPSIHPLLKIVMAWSTFLNGGNPYDTFYDKNVIPRSEMEQGGTKPIKTMALWSLSTMGGRVITDLISYDKETNTTQEYTLKNLPIINAFIRSSNYGEVQALIDEGEKVTEQKKSIARAKKAIGEKFMIKAINDGINPREADWYIKENEMLIKEELNKIPELKDSEDYDEVLSQTKNICKLNIIKGIKSPESRIIQMIINTKDNDVRVAYLKKYKEIEPNGYENVYKYLEENKIVPKIYLDKTK